MCFVKGTMHDRQGSEARRVVAKWELRATSDCVEPVGSGWSALLAQQTTQLHDQIGVLSLCRCDEQRCRSGVSIPTHVLSIVHRSSLI